MKFQILERFTGAERITPEIEAAHKGVNEYVGFDGAKEGEAYSEAVLAAVEPLSQLHHADRAKILATYPTEVAEELGKLTAEYTEFIEGQAAEDARIDAAISHYYTHQGEIDSAYAEKIGLAAEAAHEHPAKTGLSISGQGLASDAEVSTGIDVTNAGRAADRRQPLPDNGKRSPVEEFGEALKRHGLLLDGTAPTMDGKWHRVAVDGDKAGQLSGSYRGFLDGRPAGQIMNYRSGEKPVKWVANGHQIDPAEIKRQLGAEKTQKKKPGRGRSEPSLAM